MYREVWLWCGRCVCVVCVRVVSCCPIGVQCVMVRCVWVPGVGVWCGWLRQCIGGVAVCVCSDDMTRVLCAMGLLQCGMQ